MIIAALTLGAAVWAAIYARRAAIATREGAERARDANELTRSLIDWQERPHVTVSVTDPNDRGERTSRRRMVVIVKNTGKTTANCSISTGFIRFNPPFDFEDGYYVSMEERTAFRAAIPRDDYATFTIDLIRLPNIQNALKAGALIAFGIKISYYWQKIDGKRASDEYNEVFATRDTLFQKGLWEQELRIWIWNPPDLSK